MVEDTRTPEGGFRQLREQIADLELALAQRQVQTRTLISAAPVGLYMNDADGKTTFVNEKCAQLVGLPPDETLEFNWAKRLHPDDRERVLSTWQKAFETSSKFELEYRWVHEDGNVVWTLGQVVPILGPDGKASMFIGTLTDITAQKNAEEESKRLERALAHAQRMESIGRLAGGVAHDFNNMLAAIVSNAELALGELGPDEGLVEPLKEILNAASRSTDVGRKLLSFARQQAITPRVLDANQAITDVLKMLRRLLPEHIDLSWEPPATPMHIKIDPVQFDQILVNLCVNARDAIDGEGRIVIRASMTEFSERFCETHREYLPGSFYRLEFSDNGSGMEPDVLTKIFEPFFTTKNKQHGTGLGLASVEGMVRQNGGFITVESEPGVGTTFKIHLPETRDAALAPEDITEPDDTGARRATILVVEDEPAILKVVSRLLTRYGHTVLGVNSPTEALKLFDQRKPPIDLLITDVVMPEMNGKELVAALAKHLPSIKCLYMSGYTADIIARQGILEESVNFIQKPFATKTLLNEVTKILA